MHFYVPGQTILMNQKEIVSEWFRTHNLGLIERFNRLPHKKAPE